MLLLHQIGSVKIGEVVRYTVTYTPSEDRILPSPESLHLRIRNTSLIALRAAFVHGPYQLYVSAAPAHFNPNQKLAHPRRYGVPEFEPMLKAGGYWTCRLLVPDFVRQSAGQGRFGGGGGGGAVLLPPTRGDASPSSSGSPERQPQQLPQPADSVSWVIEVASQVLFSTSAAVHYEIMLGRDEKSLDLGSSAMGVLGGGQTQTPAPGDLSDFQRSHHHRTQSSHHAKGVFSRAIALKVEDTAALWNTPSLLGWDAFERMRTHVVGHAKAKAAGPVFAAAVDLQESADGAKLAGKDSATLPPGKEEEAGADPGTATKESQDTDKIEGREQSPESDEDAGPRKKIHLVMLTHGLHSNLGADMLFLKESIDAAAKQAKIDARTRREKATVEKKGTIQKSQQRGEANDGLAGDDKQGDAVVDDDEEVVVRGFAGNATRTERGIKYLGKRLARHILSITYPDQPFLPASLTAAQTMARALHTTSSGANKDRAKDGGAGENLPPAPAHKNSTIHRTPHAMDGRTFRITKISFVGHSLGGLVQLYAIAYIQKHSPQFFDVIEPVNYIALASPLLGLNHENPLYVKFALDFGLVGRTGQDLGLTWRAPTIARNGWSALVSNLGESAHKRMMGSDGGESGRSLHRSQAESKPLLRILPTGPAHVALEKFRNRTLYCNVVNDGIVPLRTSCLLFLDWQGLDRVEKARREAGLVETFVGFGWSELMGANATTPRTSSWQGVDDEDEDQTAGKGSRDARVDADGGTSGSAKAGQKGDEATPDTPASDPDSHVVPQPSGDAILEDDRRSLRSGAAAAPSWAGSQQPSSATLAQAHNPFSSLFSLFKTSDGFKRFGNAPPTEKQTRIYQRSQTLLSKDGSEVSTPTSTTSSRSRVTAGHELEEEKASAGGTDAGGASDGGNGGGSSTRGQMSAPPTTTFFEAAGDLLNPKLPSVEYLIDPSKRPRTIFHDRVYHPSDIPPPPLKKVPHSGAALIRRRTTLKKTPPADAAGAGAGCSSKSSAGVSTNSAATGKGSGNGNGNGSAGGGSGIAKADPPTLPDAPPQAASLPSPTAPEHDVAAPDAETEVIDSSGMRVEEKIARAYHRGLAWRKVLVRLEPDAHNNIIVRRKFANAFGWPVVKHLVDAHFSDSAAAREADSTESSAERAPEATKGPDSEGRETDTQTRGVEGAEDRRPRMRSGKQNKEESDKEKDDATAGTPRETKDVHPDEEADEAGEADDVVPDLPSTPSTRTSTSNRSGSGGSPSDAATGRRNKDASSPARPLYERLDSMTWSERDWEDSGAEDSDDDGGYASPMAASKKKSSGGAKKTSSADGGGGGWNWAEKLIVGKGAGAGRGPKSPRGGFGVSGGAGGSEAGESSPTTPTLLNPGFRSGSADAAAAAPAGSESEGGK